MKKRNLVIVAVSIASAILAASSLSVSRARDTVLVPQTPLTPMYVRLANGRVVPAVLMVQSDGLKFYATVGTTSYPVDSVDQ